MTFIFKKKKTFDPAKSLRVELNTIFPMNPMKCFVKLLQIVQQCVYILVEISLSQWQNTKTKVITLKTFISFWEYQL